MVFIFVDSSFSPFCLSSFFLPPYMTEQFVPYHMMQFQKLKHIMAKFFETKSMAKKVNKHYGTLDRILFNIRLNVI